MSKLSLRGITKTFGDHTVLDGVSLDIEQGQVVSLIGPSGSGKSTLLRCINLLEPVDDGAVFLDGEDISVPGLDANAVRRRIGMVFQSYNLFPHMSVMRNITLSPVRAMGMDPAAARERAMGLLERFGLADKAESYPDQLSGGQQQRVAIARALVNDPALILADEPTGALDSRTSVEVMALLQSLNREGITIVLVTHEPDVAAFATRIIAFRDGRVVRDTANEPNDAARALRELEVGSD